ncbi:MAG: hypothetical protein ISS28_02530, partial [Candidatus Cloacimonetes bacterium]|nr:hypothetical protein [Candidatus Cloacimonadota bacterium]
MKKYIYLLIIPFIISCTNIQFKNSLKTYNNKNYKSAIEQFDKYIEEGNNSALKVKAKLYRSKAYYILGKNEIENDNYNTASELLFLANSDKADTLLDNCYYQIAKELIRNDDYDKGLNYLKFIIDNLSNSNLMPEVLFTKLKIEFEVNDDIETSYQTYKVLQNNFPDSKSYYSGKKIVNQYMPELLEKVKVLRKNNEFELALEKLFIYIKYPADYTNEIESLIGNVYFSWAEKLIKNKKLLEAEEYFRTAEKYNPQLSNSVAEKLNQICSIYIEDGDKLLTQRKINEAVEAYKTSLNVIEDYQPAIKKIEHAEEIAAKIKRANELVSEGDKYFNDKEYQKALNIYNQAYQLD